MGDPAGIGPEIVLKALAGDGLWSVCRPVIIGDYECLKRAAGVSQIDFDYEAVSVEGLSGHLSGFEKLICDLKNVPAGLTPGSESAAAGAASAEYISTAAALCQSKAIDAIATAPINKRSFNAGGYDFPGHTEFLAKLTNSDEFSMSFFAGKLRVVLLSTHISLLEAIGLVKKESLCSLIRFTSRELKVLLGREIKIAVAGLNPHASEGGMFGAEEADEIEPAIRECRELHGINVSGPYSPDTVFIRGFEGEFDAVVSCYHDQATIAVKCLSFGKAVNVTLGLPIIRTSVDHGTAFDIAGQNMAECGSMEAAIKLAAELAGFKSGTA